MRVLAGQGIGEIHLAKSGQQVFFMHELDLVERPLQGIRIKLTE
jgi:hypothetical protein